MHWDIVRKTVNDAANAPFTQYAPSCQNTAMRGKRPQLVECHTVWQSEAKNYAARQAAVWRRRVRVLLVAALTS